MKALIHELYKCVSARGQIGSAKVTVLSWIRSFSTRTAGVTAIIALASLVFATTATQTHASPDDWLNFDKQDTWDPGFDRSFSRQWETQPERGYPTISPTNLTFMRAAVKRYANIVARGGWDPIPMIKLHTGSSHRAVIALRRRLQAEGDLARDDGGYLKTYDSYVEAAVKRAQLRNGLPPTGTVDKATIMALNVPASARLRQLRTNLTRIKQLRAPTKGRYVVVNIPAAQIEAINNDKVISRHVGVVGKVDRPTPILKSKIHEINFNKEWILPPTVINKDLIPKARTGKPRKVFEHYGVDIYTNYTAFKKDRPLDPAKIDWSSPAAASYFYAQKAGEENPLGYIKINFPSPHQVYMHDTPAKSIFARNFRAESSGCIRVQNIPQLAAWLLRDNGWSLHEVADMKQSRERLDVKLKQKVPLYFAYVTSWATPDGMAHFRRDLYGRDGVGVTATAY
jgi:murein L,D-transpeptidase YcbB/YkuD